MAERSDVRQFITRLGPTLERAQSQGILARTKLDVRDQFETSIASEDEEAKARSLRVFNEELEAFCADMRLAVVTVQQQVERHARRWGRGIMLGLLGSIVFFFLGIGVFSSGAKTLGGLMAFVGAPILFVLLLIACSEPEELAPVKIYEG